MFSSDRSSQRGVFIDAWQKAKSHRPLEPVEAQIAGILRQHPEYQPLIEAGEEALERDYLPELGETNPFLHLGLHLAVQDQLSIGQPHGIRQLYQRLLRQTGDAHAAEHCIMTCLAEAIWTIQHDRQPFDERAYLRCIKRAGKPRRA